MWNLVRKLIEWIAKQLGYWWNRIKERMINWIKTNWQRVGRWIAEGVAFPVIADWVTSWLW